MIHFYKKPDMYRTLCGITYEQVNTALRAPTGIVVATTSISRWADSVAWDIDCPANMVQAMAYITYMDENYRPPDLDAYLRVVLQSKYNQVCGRCQRTKLFRDRVLEIELSQ